MRSYRLAAQYAMPCYANTKIPISWRYDTCHGISQGQKITYKFHMRFSERLEHAVLISTKCIAPRTVVPAIAYHIAYHGIAYWIVRGLESCKGNSGELANAGCFY